MKTETILIFAIVISVICVMSASGDDFSALTNAESVAACLHRFPYSDTNISTFAEADFSQRRATIDRILKLDFIVTSSNSLFAIADFLAEGNRIPIDRYHEDIMAAHRYDRFVEYGDSNHVVRAGGGHYGPVARACRQQYSIRNAYNDHLKSFKCFVLEEVHWTLNLSRWSFIPISERKALWSEFKRRANATSEEIAGIEEL